MELSDKQRIKLEKMSHLKSDSELILLEEIESTKKDLSEQLTSISEQTDTKLEELSNKIESIEIPEQKDHTAHMEKMMEMINEPQEIEVTLNII